MKISKVDKIEIERLLNLKTADMIDKNSAQRLIQTYIDNGSKYCLTCEPSVRSMFKRLRGWYEVNKDNKK